MKRFLPYSFLLLLIAAPAVTNAQISAILGKWYTVDSFSGKKQSVILFEQLADGSVIGTVVDMVDPKEKNKICAKGANKGQPVIGTILFRNFHYQNGILQGGTVYNPDDGNNYYAKMWIEDGKLMMRGGLDKRLIIAMTQKWERVTDNN